MRTLRTRLIRGEDIFLLDLSDKLQTLYTLFYKRTILLEHRGSKSPKNKNPWYNVKSKNIDFRHVFFMLIKEQLKNIKAHICQPKFTASGK